jgi:hypothetical protein
MKVKVNQVLNDAEGNPLPYKEKVSLTLRDICSISILNPIQGDEEKTKLMKYDIFKKLRNLKANEIELTAEEIALVKKSVAYFQPPLIMGQCFEMIEGK